MQLVIDSLDRPWGLALQFSLIARWLRDDMTELKIVTDTYDESVYPELSNLVRVSSNPSRALDPESPTISGPYPATNWIYRAGVTNYSVCLSHIPWGLYPSKQGEWIGSLPVYIDNNWTLLGKSLKQLFTAPFTTVSRMIKRRRDRKTVQEARNIYVYDERLSEPVKDVYNREPELVAPTAAIGRGQTSDPENYILAIGPYDSPQNIKLIIESFYLFVNRLGTQRKEDWESSHPLRMWRSGSFELRLHGDGEGIDYLRSYASSQGLDEQIKFNEWPNHSQLDDLITSALAVIDIPLTGNASSLPYHAMSMGVPAVYSSRHSGLESLVKEQSLNFPVGCNDKNEIARALLGASKVPKSKRAPNDVMREAMDPESVSKFYREEFQKDL